MNSKVIPIDNKNSNFATCVSHLPYISGVAKAGVTGNPIRAYYDPGGSDPLAELIRRIGFASGSVFGISIP